MATCPHGFDPSQCLICHTLGPGTTTAASGPALSGTPATRGGGGAPARGSHRGLGMACVAVVGGGVAVWAFGGLFSLAFHVLEYVVVAGASGWTGYKVGHARGRHQGREDKRR